MIKIRHYYQVLLLLGGLCTTTILHAADYEMQEDYKQEEEPHNSLESFYTHGDLTFIGQETDKVNEKKLKEGLIDLFSRIKAKGGRKVFFFIGTTGSGKSLTVLALQGHTLKPIEEDLPFVNPQFEVEKYVLPKNEMPVVGDGWESVTNSTYIYYPDPQKPAYQGIAFADTESFCGIRKATSAGKCLSAVSFFYAAKVNSIGGLVLVISASELATRNGQGLRNMAHILQAYFAKALRKPSMKQSLLLMITKVDGKSNRDEAERQLKQRIQSFYQAYYSSNKNQEKNRYVKLFFDMLLTQDVPKDQINDLNNFTLDKKMFCFIFPSEKKHVEQLLDKRITALQPISPNDLSTFNNPVSQYIQAKIRDFSNQLNQAIKPLVALKLKITQRKKELERMAKEQDSIDHTIETIKKHIESWIAYQRELETNHTLETVFKGSHYENLLTESREANKETDEWNGYKLCKAFAYTADEPIYQIEATYGPEADLSEERTYWQLFGGVSQKFPFIEAHFTTTERVYSSGKVKWEAIAKNGRGVVNKAGWFLYHVTKGTHRAECDIKFYARKSELLATQGAIMSAENTIQKSKQSIAFYQKRKNTYNLLADNLNTLTKKWEAQRAIQLKTWESTAHMLHFFADNILTDYLDKKLIQKHLENFEEATQPKACKENNPAGDEDQPNDHQMANAVLDDDIFDID